MKAHPKEQLRLLELAQVDARHARLQHLAKNMPEQIHLVEIEQDRRTRRAAAAEALGVLEDARSELATIQSDSKLVAERRARDEKRLSSASSTKDIAALQAELDTIARRQETLDDQELAQLEQVETLTEAHDEKVAAMREIEAQAADLLERRDLARENLRKEAKELATDRKTLVDSLSAELVALYEERRKRAGVGAAELVGKVSTASQETIETADLARITKAPADEVLFCPDTGAILVRTERSAS
ncbi:MAG: zinc ribbon domain-containing protein [Gulosibacter sp.]|uniref:zinc ribbon domain-containing protein n=1 Tax=Gulosibacter sp. TaxID=2817531 RepID=UPI003F91338B